MSTTRFDLPTPATSALTRWFSGDQVFRNLILACALTIPLIMLAFAVVIAVGAWPAIRQTGLGFLVSSDWKPAAGEFGGLAFIFGTLVSSLIGLLIAVPLSLWTAIFLVEQAPRRLTRLLAFLVELLAAIPSVVYGLWGIFILAPFMRQTVDPFLQRVLGATPLFGGRITGYGMLTAGVILALMIIPIVTSVSREVMAAVPGTQREAALALGATKWEATRIVLGAAWTGIAGAIVLGLGRALGETMAVTMVIGNVPQLRASLFESGSTVASLLASNFTEAPNGMFVSSLLQMGLLLLVVTFAVNAAARLLVWRVERSVTGVA